jgi:hypothetical protein
LPLYSQTSEKEGYYTLILSGVEIALALACSRPAQEFLLLAMALNMTGPGFISQFLECSHCISIKTTSKLPNITNSLLRMALYKASIFLPSLNMSGNFLPDVLGKQI